MASTRRPIIAGNWKMFKTTNEAARFTESLWTKVQPLSKNNLPEIVICPPYTALSTVKETTVKLTAPFIVAAQNMESRDNGAYTGEISPLMLLDLKIQWVVIGHSERRQYFNETDETVAQKTLAALQHAITPIVCVGESLQERENGSTDRVIEQQVRAVLEKISASDLPKIVFAYEPVWAIGTGKVCEASEANRVCALIRHFINEYGSAEQTRILYGGSVKPENTQALMSQSDIDGGLVGGASLEPDSFFGIIEQACLVKA
jgi:triosephosphate isomerase (TIM)